MTTLKFKDFLEILKKEPTEVSSRKRSLPTLHRKTPRIKIYAKQPDKPFASGLQFSKSRPFIQRTDWRIKEEPPVDVIQYYAFLKKIKIDKKEKEKVEKEVSLKTFLKNIKEERTESYKDWKRRMGYK